MMISKGDAQIGRLVDRDLRAEPPFLELREGGADLLEAIGVIAAIGQAIGIEPPSS